METECGIRVVDVFSWTRKGCAGMTIITRAARSPFPPLAEVDPCLVGTSAPPVDEDDGLAARGADALDEGLTEEECACLPKKDASFHQRSCESRGVLGLRPLCENVVVLLWGGCI